METAMMLVHVAAWPGAASAARAPMLAWHGVWCGVRRETTGRAHRSRTLPVVRGTVAAQMCSTRPSARSTGPMSRLVATFSFFCASSLPKSKPSIIADDSGSHSWYHARVSPQSSSSPTIVLHWLNVGHELPPLGIYWAKASVVVEEELKWRWRWRWWHLHRGHNRLYRVINRTVLILIAVGFDDRCILQGQLRAEFRKGGKARARLQFPLANS